MLTVDFSYVPSTRLRKFLSVPNFLSVYFMKGAVSLLLLLATVSPMSSIVTDIQ